MKYENLIKIMNNYLGKEEHWLAYNEYSKNRSYSWRTVNFYYNIELPLKEDLKPFEKLLNNTKKTIKKIKKKEDSQELTELKEELIKQSKFFKDNIQTFKNIIEHTYKKLKENKHNQEQHLLLKDEVANNFEDYFKLYQKSMIKYNELIKTHNKAENIIEQMEDKSLINYLKEKLLSKKKKQKIY